MTHIRTANASDAKALAKFASRTFIEAFAIFNTDEDMAQHCQTHFNEETQCKEIANPDYLTIIAEHEQELVAYAQIRWSKFPSCVVANAPGEISKLYVDRHWHGKGLAQELMQACFDRLRKKNSDLVWLGVWENNPKAIAYYEKCGFKKVGSHEFMLGNDCQRDLIMIGCVNKP